MVHKQHATNPKAVRRTRNGEAILRREAKRSSRSVRFDDPEYVMAWRRAGVFPIIHHRLARMVGEESKGQTFVDLCAGTGLLGRRLVTDYGMTGGAIEASKRSILNGAYGGDLMAFELRITPETLADVTLWVRTLRATIAVARRCLPELLDSGVEPRALANALREGGIDELFVEGRKASVRSVHPLASIDREVSALLPEWRVVSRRGECAYLVPS